MPGVVWLKNLIGLSVRDEDLARVPYPRTEMCVHVTMKTVQCGAIGGVGLVGPLIAVQQTLDASKLNVNRVARYAYRYGRYGVLIGLVAGPALTFWDAKFKPLEQVQSECYRLRKNVYQCRVDRCSVAGAALGYTLAGSAAQAASAGSLFGLCLGLLMGEIYQTWQSHPQGITLDSHLQQQQMIASIHSYNYVHGKDS